ncbi:hypothetical protein HN873_037541, partial [Arachis hypogaea]
ELHPRNFIGQVQVPSSPCFLRLPENLQSGAHNEIEFSQFKFSFAKFVTNSDMQFQRLKLPAFFCMHATPLRGIRVSLVSRCGNSIPCRIA